MARLVRRRTGSSRRRAWTASRCCSCAARRAGRPAPPTSSRSTAPPTWGALYEVSGRRPATRSTPRSTPPRAATAGEPSRWRTDDGARHDRRSPTRSSARSRASSRPSPSTSSSLREEPGAGAAEEWITVLEELQRAAPDARRLTPNDEGRPDLRDALPSHRDWFHRGGGLAAGGTTPGTSPEGVSV